MNCGAECAGQPRKLELTLEVGEETEAPAVSLEKLMEYMQAVQGRGGRRRRVHLQISIAVKEVSHVKVTGSEEEEQWGRRQCAADSEAAAVAAGTVRVAAAATPVEELLRGT